MSERGRVLLLIKGLGRGGAEQILATSARHLDRERFAYEVAYLLPWKDALVKEIEGAGIPVRCLDGGRGAGWTRRLRRLVVDGGFDLIHAHSPVAASAARLLLDRRCRIVYTEHNVWGRYHRATYLSNLATFPRNDHVFAVAESVRESIRYPKALAWRYMPPVETLVHGIDADTLSHRACPNGVRRELGIPESAPLVGTIANLKAHKRIDLLLSAVDRLRRDVPDVRVVVVGAGPLEGELRRLSTRLDLDHVVTFTGFREDAPRIASAFDVFVLSSEHEGLSIALIEAMALGKPVVVTDVGGLSEVVTDGEEGFLVAAGDTAALAGSIERLLVDPELRGGMGGKASARARGFDIRVAVASMERVYEQLLQDPRPSTRGATV